MLKVSLSKKTKHLIDFLKKLKNVGHFSNKYSHFADSYFLDPQFTVIELTKQDQMKNIKQVRSLYLEEKKMLSLFI